MNRVIPALCAASSSVLLIAAAAPPVPKFNASSVNEGDVKNTPDLAFDGLLETSWAEGKPGDGVGEWLEIDFGEDKVIGTVSIWGGAFDGQESWKGRNRIAEAALVGVGADGEWRKAFEIGDRFTRKDVSVGGKKAKSLRLVIDAVHEGSVFDQLHVAEIAFDLSSPPDPLWQEAIDKDLAKDKKLKDVPQKAQEALDAAYQACKANTDYSANFKLLGSAAVRGPAWRIPLIQKHVPPGHRLKLLQFDEAQIERLGKLKDPNAIPYLQIAGAGAIKTDDREWLFHAVELFEAYQDLRKSMRQTVPNWGSEGMEKGALRGRGEPLDIDVDSVGNVWVADVGNNRVQRFSAAGTVDLVIGPDKDIAERWFTRDGDPYASGSKPGDGPQEFQQPMAVAVGNYDVVCVVDAQLKARTFAGADGAPKAQWQIETEFRPEPGRGNGTPTVTWLGDDFYILVKNEVFIYGSDGVLKKRYALEGGDVQTAVIGAGGKLLVRHAGSRDIVEYNPADGFRQGLWLKKPPPDDGSEDWDLATDSKDDVYLATDAGKVYKWNKKGKFLGEYVVWENARDMPRAAVSGTVIYVSGKDEIGRVQQTE